MEAHGAVRKVTTAECWTYSSKRFLQQSTPQLSPRVTISFHETISSSHQLLVRIPNGSEPGRLKREPTASAEMRVVDPAAEVPGQTQQTDMRQEAQEPLATSPGHLVTNHVAEKLETCSSRG